MFLCLFTNVDSHCPLQALPRVRATRLQKRKCRRFQLQENGKRRVVDVQQASGGTCRTREMTSRPRAPGWTGGQCGPGERAGRDRHRRLAPCVCKRQQRSDGPGRRQERAVPTRGKAEGVSPSRRRTPFAARSRPVGTPPTTRAAGRTDTRARGVVQPAGTAATWVSQPTCTGPRAAPRARPLMRVCGASSRDSSGTLTVALASSGRWTGHLRLGSPPTGHVRNACRGARAGDTVDGASPSSFTPRFSLPALFSLFQRFRQVNVTAKIVLHVRHGSREAV